MFLKGKSDNPLHNSSIRTLCVCVALFLSQFNRGGLTKCENTLLVLSVEVSRLCDTLLYKVSRLCDSITET